MMICEVQGIPIYFETIGKGRPFLVLHGGGGDHRCMINILEPVFAAHPGWQRIYPDLPGHGRTPAPEWLKNHDQVLEIVLGFIDQVIPGVSYALAGGSRGGYLAQGVLAKRAAALTGLLLIIPVSSEKNKGTVPAKTVLVKDESVWREMQPVEAGYMDGYVVQDRKALEDIRRSIPSYELSDRAYQQRIMQPENYSFSFDVDEEPAVFDKPALILAGRQDSMVGYQGSIKLEERFPRGTLAVLDRAGHALPIEQQPLFRALVAEWLERVEENLRTAK